MRTIDKMRTKVNYKRNELVSYTWLMAQIMSLGEIVEHSGVHDLTEMHNEDGLRRTVYCQSSKLTM